MTSHERQSFPQGLNWYVRSVGCTRYFMRTSESGLSIPRNLEQIQISNATLFAENEDRKTGFLSGISYIDDYRSWFTLLDSNVVVQMLDPEDEVTNWPSNEIGQKRLLIDVPINDDVFLRIKPEFAEIKQDAALKILLPIDKRKPHIRDHIEVRDQPKPTWMIMFDRFMHPYFIKNGQQVDLSEFFKEQTIVNADEDTRLFLNRYGFFAHENADTSYTKTCLMKVNRDNTLQAVKAESNQITGDCVTYNSSGIDRTFNTTGRNTLVNYRDLTINTPLVPSLSKLLPLLCGYNLSCNIKDLLLDIEKLSNRFKNSITTQIMKGELIL